MTIRKTKSGKWTVDVSNGFHPVTQKRIRIIRKGLKSKKEALELEQHIRVVELKEKQFDFVVTTDMLFDLLEEDDLKNGRKVSYTSTQRNNYERHIKPYFKNTNLNKLTFLFNKIVYQNFIIFYSIPRYSSYDTSLSITSFSFISIILFATVCIN